MLLSIIIPCYNYDHNLEILCKSLVQEYSGFAEIILVNDGSTDNTKVICDNLEKKHPNIKSIHQANQGPAVARQNGTDKAIGEWIYYIDADDQTIIGIGEKIHQLLKSKPKEEVLIGGFISVTSSGKEKIKIPSLNCQTPPEWVKAFLNKKISIINGAVLLKKVIFEKVNWDSRFSIVEDKIFYTHCLAQFRVRLIDFAMCKVIHHSESLRNNASKAVEQIPDFVEALFEKNKLPEQIYKMKKNYYSQRHLSASRIYFINGEKLKGREQFLKAFHISPISALNKSYLKKFLLSFI